MGKPIGLQVEEREAPIPEVTDEQRRAAARVVAGHARDRADLLHLLRQLGYAPWPEPEPEPDDRPDMSDRTCKRGHPLTRDNLARNGPDKWRCRTCKRLNARKRG